MNLNANKLAKHIALVSVCACVAFAAYIVGMELGYLRTKISSQEVESSTPITLRWPDGNASLLKLQAPPKSGKDQHQSHE
ncbi:hypothetical protein AABC73_06830 [Pseudomonas sp. G.S.17]|uniref:hypothetical protein n=1 Tax=Pseudomonas sp. G.S.17 TaxID=3137451 RepID=UPI00311CCB4B